MIGGRRYVVLAGPESTGKTTLAQMLCGRLRTNGLLAHLSSTPGSTMPFPAALLDTSGEAHLWGCLNRLQVECAASLLPGVEVVVCDRGALDLPVAMRQRRAHGQGQAEVERLAARWAYGYDAVYLLSPADAPYRRDGFREDAAEDRRDGLYQMMRDAYEAACPGRVHLPPGSLRERSEWVYQHALWTLTGRGKAARVIEQVRSWFESRGHGVSEVHVHGSNSIHRFHPASDHDDFDLVVLLRGGWEEARAAREDFRLHRTWLEGVIEGDLDVMVMPASEGSHEV